MHDLEISDANARGYFDGRYEGVENNVFDAPALRVAYTSGYERGVADYCFYEVSNERA